MVRKKNNSFYFKFILIVFYLDTFIKLIEISRNETHLVLQRGYNKLYQSYRLSIDKFFNNLLTLSYRTYQHDIKIYVDQLFRNILHISLTLNNNTTILPTYFSCLWKNHPFSNNPNLLEKQLEIYLGKIFHLYELFKLSHDLVQILSTVSIFFENRIKNLVKHVIVLKTFF